MIIADNHFIRHKILASVAILEACPPLRNMYTQIQKLEKQCMSCGGAAEAKKKLQETWDSTRQLLVNLSESQKNIIRQHASGGQPISLAVRTGTGAQSKIVTAQI